ncbi:hypothetical protein Y1Q_0016240 [Alligator mississippiensis]|uniref:Uncharacterized protein n=1 Tax=Alligator mississippiensis TaxID=8496 RepID=A0A151MQ30_ALLMI|nr:hypothetical protein Y1Q_0016240 [Alligator mississippiensis]
MVTKGRGSVKGRGHPCSARQLTKTHKLSLQLNNCPRCYIGKGALSLLSDCLAESMDKGHRLYTHKIAAACYMNCTVGPWKQQDIPVKVSLQCELASNCQISFIGVEISGSEVMTALSRHSRRK